jgi:hypothetical protein
MSRSGEFLPNENHPGFALHAPTWNWIERRRAQGLAGPQAEAGMVEWTSDGVVDDQPIGQRAVIVRAVRADGEPFIARSRKEHVFVGNTPQHHSAAGDIALWDALR